MHNCNTNDVTICDLDVTTYLDNDGEKQIHDLSFGSIYVPVSDSFDIKITPTQLTALSEITNSGSRVTPKNSEVALTLLKEELKEPIMEYLCYNDLFVDETDYSDY